MISTKRMPRILGIILIAGGIGYVLSGVLIATVETLPSAISNALVLPATVGELWTVGYLLIRDIRPAQSVEPVEPVEPAFTAAEVPAAAAANR